VSSSPGILECTSLILGTIEAPLENGDDLEALASGDLADASPRLRCTPRMFHGERGWSQNDQHVRRRQICGRPQIGLAGRRQMKPRQSTSAER
jgi:hypothetical protein